MSLPDDLDPDDYGVCEQCGDVFSHDDLLQVTIASPGQVWGGAMCSACSDGIDDPDTGLAGASVSRPREPSAAPAGRPAPEP